MLWSWKNYWGIIEELPLYGVDRLIEDKEEQLKLLDVDCMVEDVIRDRKKYKNKSMH